MDVEPGPGGSDAGRSGALLAGRYEVGALIGLGGTAQVYRAWDRERRCAVAVKVFRPGSEPVPSRGSAWELEVLTGIRHPGLVGVHDSGVDGSGCPFVVMDLVDGTSLSARLHDGPLPAATVAGLGAVLADALAAVHGRGVVHRDVKPANVLLDAGDRPWLTDFGIARLVDATRVTATGVVVGTAAYMAPEQVRGEAVGPAADVYALGLVLLEAVTGRREYDGGALESALARLHRRPAVPAQVPEPLASALGAMTAPEPGDRPTAVEVAAVLRGTPAGTRVPARRRLVPVGALACLVAAVLGGGLMLVDQDPSAGSEAAVVAQAAPPPVVAAVPPGVPEEVAAPEAAPVEAALPAQPVPVALSSDEGVAARPTGGRTLARAADPGTERRTLAGRPGRTRDDDPDDDRRDGGDGHASDDRTPPKSDEGAQDEGARDDDSRDDDAEADPKGGDAKDDDAADNGSRGGSGKDDDGDDEGDDDEGGGSEKGGRSGSHSGKG